MTTFVEFSYFVKTLDLRLKKFPRPACPYNGIIRCFLSWTCGSSFLETKKEQVKRPLPPPILFPALAREVRVRVFRRPGPVSASNCKEVSKVQYLHTINVRGTRDLASAAVAPGDRGTAGARAVPGGNGLPGRDATMGGAPSRGPALVAASAKTTRDHAATRGRRAERPSPSPSSPLVAARRGRSVRRRGARGRVRATTPVRPRRLPRGARGERSSTAGSTSSSLAGPSRRTGGRATLPASEASGPGRDCGAFDVVGFRGARCGMRGRLGARGGGRDRLDLARTGDATDSTTPASVARRAAMARWRASQASAAHGAEGSTNSSSPSSTEPPGVSTSPASAARGTDGTSGLTSPASDSATAMHDGGHDWLEITCLAEGVTGSSSPQFFRHL